MAIYRKGLLNKHLKALDAYYAELRKALEGHAPDTLLARGFNETKESFAEEYAAVHIPDLMRLVGHFKVEVDALKELKTQASKPSKF